MRFSIALCSIATTLTKTSRADLPKAAKVKIQSLTGTPIQMFEVEVISDGENVTFGKTATQSSTFKNKKGFSASKAVDGQMDRFSRTKRNDECAWWMVDLRSAV